MLLEPGKWWSHAEVYDAVAASCRTDARRAVYAEWARLCERVARDLERAPDEPGDGSCLGPEAARLPGNRLLAALPVEDVRLLQPHLVPVEFPRRYCFSRRHAPIEAVHFIEQGLASIRGGDWDIGGVETGLIGAEGVAGLAVIMEDDRSAFSTLSETPGSALRIGASTLRDLMNRSATLRTVLLRYARTVLVQVSQTAFANARCKIDQRLARWLLMAADRCRDDGLPLTHAALASLLGVRRAGVTVTLHELEATGLIRLRPRQITVVDRAGLERLAGSAYGAAEATYRRLIGG